MLNNINNNYEDVNIITKSQMYEKMQPDKILGDSFAKTINYHGIHSNFCLDIPEIIEEEKRQQERKEDIAKFTKLAMSDFENNSHDKLVEELFSDNDTISSYTNSVLKELSNNKQLFEDLGI